MNGQQIEHNAVVAPAPVASRTTGPAPRRRRRGLVAILLVAAFAATACTVTANGGRERPIIPAPAAPSAEQPAAPRASRPVAPAANAAPAATAVPGSVEAAVQRVIERGNDEQVQAIAARNPRTMADTSTSRYYQELVQTNQDLLDHGVTAIKLVRLEWGAVSVNGSTATATTYETWRTTYADGITDESRDRNVYTLVKDGDAWRIDADDHPDDAQTPAGASSRGGAVPTPEPRAPDPQVPLSQNTSSNWSGYAAGSGTFTAVSGTWTVPQAPLNGSFGAGAAWVGIGGLRSRDLIQAGTQEVVSSAGHVTYQAWIETLPEASRQVPLSVAPGDSVTVSIGQQSPGNWLVSMTNNSTGQTYQKNVPYDSSLSSAEWIEEAPSMGRRGVVPLDDFGSIQFTNASAVKDGKTVTIAQAGARAITMIGAGRQPLAQPSALGSDGASFTVDRVGSTAGGAGAAGSGAGSSSQGSQPGRSSRGSQSGQGGQASQSGQGSRGGQGAAGGFGGRGSAPPAEGTAGNGLGPLRRFGA